VRSIHLVILALYGLLATSCFAQHGAAAESAAGDRRQDKTPFAAEHVSRTHSFSLPLPVREAVALFEPEGEKRYAEGWEPRYLAPVSGKTVEGMVFTTGHGDDHTIWTLVRYRPQDGLVEYVRDTPGSRTGIVRVRCRAVDPQSTRVEVTYTLTALSEAGNTYLRKFDETHYRAFIESWPVEIEKAGLTRRK